MKIGEIEFDDDLDEDCDIFVSGDGYLDKAGALKIIEHLKEVFCVGPDKPSDTGLAHLTNSVG